MQGLTGYFELTGTNGVTVKISHAESYEIIPNSSALAISGIQVKSSDYYGVTYYLDGSIKIDGKTAAAMSSSAGTNAVTIPALNKYADVSGQFGQVADIIHNIDGSKSVVVDVDIRGFTRSGGGGSGWRVSGSVTVPLTSIPRASTIGATDANIGAVSMIAVSRKSQNYVHSIFFQFLGASGYITEDGGISDTEQRYTATSIAFRLPESFFALIPNAKSAPVKLIAKTYSGDTQIGDAQTATFTATAAEVDCAPLVIGSVIDSNPATISLTGDSKKLVRFKSTAFCEISTEPQRSATITEKRIAGKSVQNSLSIQEIEASSVQFAATDSRGYTTTDNIQLDLVPYIKLSLSGYVARVDPTSGKARLIANGNYYNGSFGAQNNTLDLEWRADRGSWKSYTPTITGNTFSATIQMSGLDYQSEHEIECRVWDKLEIVTAKYTLMVGVPVYNWGANFFRTNQPSYLTKATPFLSDRYSGQADQTEQQFNAWLDTVLASMPDRSVRMIQWQCYPAVSGATYCGILYKHIDGYAALRSFTYANASAQKNRLGSSWGATKLTYF